MGSFRQIGVRQMIFVCMIRENNFDCSVHTHSCRGDEPAVVISMGKFQTQIAVVMDDLRNRYGFFGFN